MTKAKVLGEKLVIDGHPADAAGFEPEMSADIYYEVVRMVNRKLLFLQDHLDRLKHSLVQSGLSYPGHSEIRRQLSLLIRSNQFFMGNIRICIQQDRGGGQRLLSYFIPYFYPDPCSYKSGVQLVSYPHERPRPEIKKWDDRFRNGVSQYIREHGAYEAVLLDRHHHVREGSRSNVFFIDRENRVVTAPAEEVLPGITRKYVLLICDELEAEVIERPVRFGEIHLLPACFISGTSPKILPVRQLDGIMFRADHPLLGRLIDRFEVILEANLEDPEEWQESG